ncbi:hypothetical protein NQ317_012516 [Molorchus minor]|uniref:Proton channel OtopLc-like n=1 Tax=Molorchus minor TaxID=1323400 RepID=A0ABQ9K381_9CUCU|nr:hypothetical protein NQ317_012516 [Molorchus minor]
MSWNMTLEEPGADGMENVENRKDDEPSTSSPISSKNEGDFLDEKGGNQDKQNPSDGKMSSNVGNPYGPTVFLQGQEEDAKNTVPLSRTPSVNTAEYNGEVLLRPPSRYGNRIVSAVVSPSGSPAEPRKVNSTGDLDKMTSRRRPISYRGKNENMVLQLVLPVANQNNSYDHNYLTAKSIDEILENGHLKERHSRPASFNTHRDFVPNGSYINRAYSSCDFAEYAQPVPPFSPMSPGSRSIIHTPVSMSTNNDKPTPPEEKWKAFIDLLTIVLSVLYGLFIVTLGLAVYVSDLIDGTHHTAEVLSLVLVVVAFLYIFYLTLDISFYMKKKRQYDKLMERNTPDEIEMKETTDGHYEFNITLPQIVTLKKSLLHHYCFNKDRHSANFYLKVGAAAFCFGHLIHSGLLLGYQVFFLATDELYECASVVQLILDICYPIYSFLLLFFIFKFSNVIINRYIIVARFGIMHCLSSSICFWLFTIFREILEALASKEYDSDSTTSGQIAETDFSQAQALPLTAYTQKGAQALVDYFVGGPTSRRFTATCDHGDESMGNIYSTFSPYLYPFSVEFSILIVGVLYLVWQNIGMCKEAQDEDDSASSTRQCQNPSGNVDNTESNVVVHVDCQSSNRGLFMGFTILVLTIVSTILFFIAIYNNDGKQGELGITVNIVTSLIILALMLIACIFGYIQIIKLDLNTAHHNLLDDVLLFICLPAYFLNGIFSIIPAVIYKNVLGSINICLEVFQVLIQTCFLLDGVRRSSNTKELRKKKPGREMVTFLVICNVALWIMQTFEVKSHGMQDNRYDFYGKELWTILGHMCLPPDDVLQVPFVCLFGGYLEVRLRTFRPLEKAMLEYARTEILTRAKQYFY